MPRSFFAAPPRPANVSPLQFAQSYFAAGSSITEKRSQPFVTEHGWHGTLHEIAVEGPTNKRLIALDFLVRQERALLYDWLAPGAPDVTVDSLRTIVPRFRNNETLAQLRELPAPPEPWPTAYRSLPLFGEMRRNWSIDGSAFDLVAAPAAGRVEIKFATSPRLSMRTLLATVADELERADGHAATTETYQRPTLGGEHLALGIVTGQSIERAVGVIFGDRHCIVVDARYTLADHPEKFRNFLFRLLPEIPLRGLPVIRVRQVVHAIPAGWTVRTRDLTTHLIAPDAKTFFTVLPVEPRQQEWTLTKKIIYEDMISRVHMTTPMTSAHHKTPTGLKAEVVIVHGTSPDRKEPFKLANAILTDERYRYVLRYEDADWKHEDTFMALVNSVEPVPTATTYGELPGEVMQKVFPVD